MNSPTSLPCPAKTAPGWIWLPALVMALGWGLRGYIGGGPFGAMIPGALVSILLCQFLGYPARAAAVVVACGALGFGFGGEMTYGQTLGLLRHADSFLWGLTGTTLKGAVWGLLGGAVLGLGFIAHHIPWRHFLLALLCLLIGVAVGIHFINQPKLIYFSDPIHKPRDESWAGLLIGAGALLAYLHTFQSRVAGIASRFATYAAIGGAIGFGGGSLLLALQSRVAEPWRWLPYWKFMEFTFGWLLGAALGVCAWRLRQRLAALGEQSLLDRDGDGSRDPRMRFFTTAIAGLLVLLAIFPGWEIAIEPLLSTLSQVAPDDPRHTLARVALGFTGMGCAFMLLSRWSQAVAWQVAISVTIVAAAIDWQRDLLPRGGIDLPELYRQLFVLGMAAMSVLYVAFWQSRKPPRLADLFLFALCLLMGIGYLMGLAWSNVWCPDPQEVATAGGRSRYLWNLHRAEIVVHLIFTSLFVISLVAGWRARCCELATPRSSEAS